MNVFILSIPSKLSPLYKTMTETIATVAIGTTLYTQIYKLFYYHISTLTLPYYILIRKFSSLF